MSQRSKVQANSKQPASRCQWGGEYSQMRLITLFCLCASSIFVCPWNLPFHSFTLSLIVLFSKWQNKNFLPQEEYLFALLFVRGAGGGEEEERGKVDESASAFLWVCVHTVDKQYSHYWGINSIKILKRKKKSTLGQICLVSDLIFRGPEPQLVFWSQWELQVIHSMWVCISAQTRK